MIALNKHIDQAESFTFYFVSPLLIGQQLGQITARPRPNKELIEVGGIVHRNLSIIGSLTTNLKLLKKFKTPKKGNIGNNQYKPGRATI